MENADNKRCGSENLKINADISEKIKGYKKTKKDKELVGVLADIDAIRNLHNELVIAYKKENRKINIESKAREIYFRRLLKKYRLLP